MVKDTLLEQIEKEDMATDIGWKNGVVTGLISGSIVSFFFVLLVLFS